MSTISYFACEISDGSGGWVDLNDSLNYKVAGAQSREGTSTSWRRILATSPVYDGQYLVHAVKDQVTEQLGIYVYSDSQVTLNTNIAALEELFSQFSYQIRWTIDDAREVWNCQAADYTWSRGHVWAHNQMAQFLAQVPRFPDVTYSEV